MKLHINNQTFRIVVAKTFSSRLKGLIGEENIDYGMLFPACNSIHTFFMKEAIDVIGLNENNEVIFIERNCKRNKMVQIHAPIKKTSILELPKNTSLSLKIGDTLTFIKD